MTYSSISLRFLEGLAKCTFGFLMICFVVGCTSLPIAAQSKVDIEITVHFPQTTVRGGEELPFNAIIKNIGSDRATDVILIADRYGLLNIISGTADAGKCVVGNNSREDRFRCELGDIAPDGTVSVRGLIKILDFDGPDLNEKPPRIDVPIMTGDLNSDRRPVDLRTSLGALSVAPAEPDANTDNNAAELKIEMLPSLNRAPRIRIVSPRDRSTLIRAAGQSVSYAVTIEASDPDGKVVTVKITDPLHSPRPVGVNEKGYVFEYEGVQYGALELEEYLRKNPPPDRLATPTGTNGYTYVMTDPPYGHNQLGVMAVDDGGRESVASINFEIKGDSTIEVVSPIKDQIVSPGSTVIVETISKLKQGRLKDVVILGDGIGYSETPVKMELVSKQGNLYRHRFEIKAVPENNVYSHVRVFLQEETGGYADAEAGYLVRHLPKITFTSFKDGDTLLRPEMSAGPTRTVGMIPVAFNIENQSLHDTYELFIDGKYHMTLSGSPINWLDPAPGKHTLQIVGTFSKVELARSPLITVTVK